MFPTYNSLAEVPEAFREHYVMKGGKAVAEVSSDHPLLVNNAALVSEKTEAERQRDEANRKKAEAETALASANVIPRGHEAVPKADADLVRAVKEAGVITAEAFGTLKTEHANYKVEAEEAKKLKHAEAVGAAMGWDKEKTARLVPKVYDLSQVEVRDGEGDQKIVIAKVKSGENFVEKPFADVVKATPELSDLQLVLIAQKQPDGTPLPSHGAGGGATKSSTVDDFIKERDDKAAARPNPFGQKAVAA